MDPLTALTGAISTLQKPREAWRRISEAEVRGMLADLSNELADAKLQAVALKERLFTLEQENSLLKSKASNTAERPSGRKWGCYQFADDAALYCTGCWNSKRQKSLTNRLSATQRQCPVCRVVFGS